MFALHEFHIGNDLWCDILEGRQEVDIVLAITDGQRLDLQTVIEEFQRIVRRLKVHPLQGKFLLDLQSFDTVQLMLEFFGRHSPSTTAGRQ